MNSFVSFVTTALAMLQGRLDRNDKGATMVEYGLIVALIAVVVIAAVTLLGTQISSLFQSVSTSL